MTVFTAQGSMFEGLYVRVLKPSGAFREDLLRAGFDVAAVKPEYPMEVWVACLDVTARHRHPGLERFAAWRLIGRDFITGFLETIVGRLVAVTLPFLSPKTFIERAPRFMRMGVKELESAVEWRGPRMALVSLNGPHQGTAFVMAGVMEVCLRRLGVEPTVEPSSGAGDASRLLISW